MDLLFSIGSSLLLLIAAGVAVVGTTWNPQQTGIKKLTKIGRIAVLVAVVAFSLSVFKTIADNQKERSVSAIALAKLQHAWANMAVPFGLVLWEIQGEKTEIETAMLQSLKRNIESSDGLDYNKTPPMPLYQSWGKVFCQASGYGYKNLENTVENYHSKLDTDILDLVIKIETSQGRKMFMKLSPCGILSPKDGFVGLVNNQAVIEYMDMLIQMGDALGVEKPNE